MVPEGRRHATSDIWTIGEAALRAISVACGTRGARGPTCAGRGSAGDRPADVAVSVAQAGIEPSVGSVGDSYDNALAETVNGLFKTEIVRRRGPWRSLEAVEFATLEWVDWFNHRRLLEPIGNIPPAKAEEHYYAQWQEIALAA